MQPVQGMPRRFNLNSGADEFTMARDLWNDGMIDGFNTFSDMDFAYSVTNSCGAMGTGMLVASDETETARDPGALGAEAEEAGTFAAYTHLVYQDVTPPTSGTLDAADAAANACMLTYTFTLQGSEVRRLQSRSCARLLP